MIKKLKEIYKRDNELLRDNITLAIGMVSVGMAGYIFHFMMGRYLGPKEYGILGSILAIIYIITVITNVIQTSITNFTSKFKTENKYGKINFLLKTSLRKIGMYSLILAIIFVIITPLLGKFLKVEDIKPIYILSSFIIISLLLPIIRGVLQGTQHFSALSFNYLIEGLTKVIVGVIIILLGLRVNGAVIAIVASYFIPLLAGFIPLKHILKINPESFETRKVYFYSIPVLITIAIITLTYSVDVLLVKHFFSETEAGYYAALALLGKIIFFLATPIIFVMFPKITEMRQNGKDYKSLLYKSIIILSLISIPMNLFYFIFPKLTVTLLFGADYIAIVPILGMFGVAMTLLSMSYLISFYNLATEKKGFMVILLLSLITEILLIYQFHSSLNQIVNILAGVMALQLISLIIVTLIKNDKVIHNNTGVQ